MDRVNLLSSLAILFLLLNATSCSQSTSKNLKTVKIDLDKTENILMSSIFSEVYYIPLETKDSSLIGDPTLKIKIFDNQIYTIENSKVLRFRPNGTFDKIIISSGRGPDQVVGPRDIAASINHLYILGIHEVIKLDYNGKIIKKLKIPTGSESIYCYSDGKILIYHGVALGTENTFKIGLYDHNLNLLKTFCPNPYTKVNRGTGVRIHSGDQKVFVTHISNDTIFDMTNESLVPYLFLDFGKFNRVYDAPMGLKLKSPHLSDLNISTNYWYLRFIYYPSQESQPIQYKLIYNSRTNKIQSTTNDLKNDLDFGLDFSPSATYNFSNQNCFYMALNPVDIIKRSKEITNEKLVQKIDNDFLEVSKIINEGSNPVLMKCFLK